MSERATQENLTGRQLEGIELLAQGLPVGEVAERLGVDRVTVWRWTQRATFKLALRERRDEVWGDLLSRARALTPLALDVIESVLMESDDAKLKIRAADLLLGAAGLSNARAIEAEKRWNDFFSPLTPADE